jgi:hypothetical protein
MQLPTALAYERKVSVNTKARQPFQFPTTHHRPRAGLNWYNQLEDRSDFEQKGMIAELIYKVNIIRLWQKKQIGIAIAEKIHWKDLKGLAANRVTAEMLANQHRQVISNWKKAMGVRYMESKGQMKEMNDDSSVPQDI